MIELVLSLFPGIGLLDRAFAAAGFCVVQAQDKITGGDIRDFHGVPGLLDGIVAGPPCQSPLSAWKGVSLSTRTAIASWFASLMMILN